jgi:hypothetical protein
LKQAYRSARLSNVALPADAGRPDSYRDRNKPAHFPNDSHRTEAAREAIAATLPLGSAAAEPEAAKGLR